MLKTVLLSIICIAFSLCQAAHPQNAWGQPVSTIRDIYEKAVEAYNQGQYDQAVSLYSQINKVAPHFAPAYVGLGLALKAKGADMDEVTYYYKTATDMDPTNTQALEQLGRLYYSMNKFDKAEKAFLKALSVDPGLDSVKLSLGWLYIMAKPKPDLAIRYFTQLSKTSPSPNVDLGLGMAYFAGNRRVEAMEMITKLRNAGQEDLAKKLEEMVRDNQRVTLPPETGPGNADNGVLTSNDARPAPAAAAGNGSSSPPVQPMGVKVRLRGKLSQAD